MNKIKKIENTPPYILSNSFESKNIKINKIKNYTFFDYDIIYDIKVIGNCKFKFYISSDKSYEYQSKDEFIIPTFTKDSPLYLFMCTFILVNINSENEFSLEFTTEKLPLELKVEIIDNKYFYTSNKFIYYAGMTGYCDDIITYFIRNKIKPISNCPPVKILGIYLSKKKEVFFELNSVEFEKYRGYFVSGEEILYYDNERNKHYLKIDYNSSFGHLMHIFQLPKNLKKIDFTCENVFYKTISTKTGVNLFDTNEDVLSVDYLDTFIIIKYNDFEYKIDFITEFNKFKSQFNCELKKILVS